MGVPTVKLSRGIHVMHLFYRIDRAKWNALAAGESKQTLEKLQRLCEANNAPSNPRLKSYVNIGGKADLAFIIYAAELGQVSAIHRALEACFPVGTLQQTYSFLSVTELPEYVTTEEDLIRGLKAEGLQEGTEAYNQKLDLGRKRQADYEHYRLNPEMPDWEIMAFYPMSKRRSGNDNWYMLDFEARKKLMLGHARVGRKYGGRISQLITGATGIDDWEWGVTLMAHQTDALKEIVYEMRFDEVSARYGEFGPFYVNMHLEAADIWEHLAL
jgi:hydrogen peroxide-dependent heme synthase